MKSIYAKEKYKWYELEEGFIQRLEIEVSVQKIVVKEI